MILYGRFDFFELHPRKTIIVGQFYFRFQPEFCFTVTAMGVNVHSRLFAGKEKESIALFSKYCGAQD
jgi:hypothetical protein